MLFKFAFAEIDTSLLQTTVSIVPVKKIKCVVKNNEDGKIMYVIKINKKIKICHTLFVIDSDISGFNEDYENIFKENIPKLFIKTINNLADNIITSNDLIIKFNREIITYIANYNYE